MLLGFDITPGKGISLISNVISELLSIPCSVLMGANLANEVSRLTTTVLDAFNEFCTAAPMYVIFTLVAMASSAHTNGSVASIISGASCFVSSNCFY